MGECSRLFWMHRKAELMLQLCLQSMKNYYPRVPVFHLQSDWWIRSFVDQAKSNGFFEFAKRLLDILGGYYWGSCYFI